MRRRAQSIVGDVTETNPFILYRERLDSYSHAIAAGWSDEQFVDLVAKLDQEIKAVDGTGFSVTPVVDGEQLAAALGLDIDLKVKVEINSVGGSHKARHLFGVALHLAVEQADQDFSSAPLAIASCGNAAIAAAIVAKAIDRPIDVFVPSWAEKPAVDLLQNWVHKFRFANRLPGKKEILVTPVFAKLLPTVPVPSEFKEPIPRPHSMAAGL